MFQNVFSDEKHFLYSNLCQVIYDFFPLREIEELISANIPILDQKGNRAGEDYLFPIIIG